jgi:UDP-glucose 4-epimerase
MRECVADRTGGSEQSLLSYTDDLEGGRVLADERLDLVGEVICVDHDAREPLLLEVSQMPSEQRLAVDLQKDLRNPLADRAEPRSSAGCKHHRVHRLVLACFGPVSNMKRETVIVTGGAGFIGSHLADALVSDGMSVVVIDDLSTGSPQRVPRDASLEVVDITDHGRIDHLIDYARPTSIFHLAAQSSVTVSTTDPRRDCAVNVVGTLNVLEAATRHRAPVVFSSTGGALYGNRAVVPTPETALPAPLAPYGASKWAGEAYIVTWREAYGIPHTVCRLGNVYGSRQSPHGEAGVIAIFSHHLWRGVPPTLFGFGRPTRDYVHVDDVVRAMITASGNGGIFNIATGLETDVRTIFSILKEAAAADVEPNLAPLRTGELDRSCMDPRRAYDDLGWQAEIGVRDGVARTYHELVSEFESNGEVDKPAAVP